VAGGDYLVIDHNSVVAQVAAPQDTEITRLGQQLNKTYVGYGAQGAASTARQAEEDKKAAAAAPRPSSPGRVSKSAKQYDNSGWDLVDGVGRGGVKLEAMGDDQLAGRDARDERAAEEGLRRPEAKEREQIQQKIQTLSTERNKFWRRSRRRAPPRPPPRWTPR